MSISLALSGADTLLGQAILDLFDERDVGVDTITILLPGSAARIDELSDNQLDTRVRKNCVEGFIEDVNFSQFGLVILAGDSDSVETIIAEAINAGASVIDCTGYSANDPNIPVIVNAINSHEIRDLVLGSVIATPSPAATLLSQVLFPLVQNEQLVRANVCHFLPVSSGGKAQVEALAGQTVRLLNGSPIESSKKNPIQQLAFNVLPHAGEVQQSGYTEREHQLMEETARLLNDDTIVINGTCIQVPVFYAQSQIVDLTFAQPVNVQQIASVLQQADGIRFAEGEQASPVVINKNVKNDDAIVISRLRQNAQDERSLTLWCASDDLRRGAAVNTVQIAEILIKSYL